MTDAKPITGPEYWNRLWMAGRPPDPINPHKGGLRNYAYRHLHLVFAGALSEEKPQGKKLIELGCGGSRWLAYFHRTHGCLVSGIDYSPQGCAAAQDLLDRMGIEGDIRQADLFHPPADQMAQFDFVFSNGLIEHFSDTAAAISACAAYLKPGGLMLSLIPNMTGPLGLLQRIFDRQLYEKHMPLTCGQLAGAHKAAGLEVISSRYILLAHLGVIQFGALERWLGSRTLQPVKIALSAPIWGLAPLFGLRPNRLTSPFVICIARKAHQAAA